MEKIEEFYEIIKKEEVITLATSFDDSVTMRLVSPVYYDGNILFFTNSNSRKYAQLKGNPNCCINANNFFVEATAEFLGETMSDENEKLREVYSKKFPGAFEEGIEYGGRDSEFLLLKPRNLKGWTFENGIPTSSFDIEI